MAELPIMDADYTDSGEGRRPAGARGLGLVAHDADTYDLAFRVWQVEGARSPRQTAEMLERLHGITVPQRTITRWVAGDRGTPWPQRDVEERTAELGPQIVQETWLNVAQAALLASRDFVRALEDGSVRSGDVSKQAVDAWRLALVSAGYTGQRVIAPDAGVVTRVIDLDGLSDDELARYGVGEVTSRTGHAT